MTERWPVDTDRMIEDHKDLVYHLIHRTVRDRAAHEEIFQEAFLNVLKSLPRFEGRSKLSTWIASVTIHTCYQFLQKARKQECVGSFDAWLERRPEPGIPSDVQEKLERSEDRRQLNRSIRKLPPKYALPIQLFYMEGLSYKEIAEILDIPMGTVKSHLFRGLGELRKMIEGGDDEPLHG